MLLELVFVASALQDRAPDPVCLADVRWSVDTVPTVSRATPVRSLTAVYFDAAHELICAGHVPQAAVQRDVPQIIAPARAAAGVCERRRHDRDTKWGTGSRRVSAPAAATVTPGPSAHE